MPKTTKAPLPGPVELDQAFLQSVDGLTDLQGQEYINHRGLLALGHRHGLIEVVVTSDSRLNGRSAQAVGLSWRQRSVLLGVSRRGKRITSQLRKTELQVGDILLLLGPRDTASHVVEWLGVLPLADRGLAVTENHKVWLAIGLFGGAVTAASFGLIYLPVALGLVVIAYVLARIVPLSELYTHIEWPVVVLLGSMIPLGAALESSGGTELIAGALVGLTQGLPAWVVLTVLMLVTMTLSDVLNNTATTIVVMVMGFQGAEPSLDAVSPMVAGAFVAGMRWAFMFMGSALAIAAVLSFIRGERAAPPTAEPNASPETPTRKVRN